mmetsp:Transcript_9560/g.18411  ORF Transcript_9560/g.18411 Transcript_9560/m.18411 type:complete len:264 (+) Transcript_9560:97-888(+)
MKVSREIMTNGKSLIEPLLAQAYDDEDNDVEAVTSSGISSSCCGVSTKRVGDWIQSIEEEQQQQQDGNEQNMVQDDKRENRGERTSFHIIATTLWVRLSCLGHAIMALVLLTECQYYPDLAFVGLFSVGSYAAFNQIQSLMLGVACLENLVFLVLEVVVYLAPNENVYDDLWYDGISLWLFASTICNGIAVGMLRKYVPNFLRIGGISDQRLDLYFCIFIALSFLCFLQVSYVLLTSHQSWEDRVAFFWLYPNFPSYVDYEGF